MHRLKYRDDEVEDEEDKVDTRHNCRRERTQRTDRGFRQTNRPGAAG